MMKWDFENIMIGIFAVAIVVIGFFIFKQMGRFDDCRERGGYAIETKQGWVCAKLEKV